MLGEEGGKDAAGVHEHGDDVFLKKIESHLLTQASAVTIGLLCNLSALASTYSHACMTRQHASSYAHTLFCASKSVFTCFLQSLVRSTVCSASLSIVETHPIHFTYAAVPACYAILFAIRAGWSCQNLNADGLLQVKLQGIPGIRKVFMRELKTTHLDQEGIYQTENQWVLDTEGVNLLDVRLPLALVLISHHMLFALCLQVTLHGPARDLQ